MAVKRVVGLAEHKVVIVLWQKHTMKLYSNTGRCRMLVGKFINEYWQWTGRKEPDPFLQDNVRE